MEQLGPNNPGVGHPRIVNIVKNETFLDKHFILSYDKEKRFNGM